MSMQPTPSERPTGWLERVVTLDVRVDAAKVILILLIVLALLTRFYDVGARVMSHDENTHVYYSWLLEQGRGYQHNPLSHGPFQFHLIAASYFLFGDTDATARYPAAIAGVLAVGLAYLFRRWLGRLAGLIAGALMLVSPFMLYYSRYARNEALVVPLALLNFYAIFRYIEDRRPRWLYLFSLSLSLHFATKETSFIHAAQVMIFLGVYLAWRLLQEKWRKANLKSAFGLGLILSALGAIAVMIPPSLSGFLEDPAGQEASAVPALKYVTYAAIGLLVVGLLIVVVSTIMDRGRKLGSDYPSFDLIIFSGTMVLPQLAAFPAKWLGWDPMSYEDTAAMTKTIIAVVALAAVSISIGLLWNWRRWLAAAGIFFGPFVVLYTAFFTNPSGLATGLVGSLGYWLEQHGVERGSQPWYYYLAVQIPIYEFLPAVGSLLAGGLGLKALLKEPTKEAAEPDLLEEDKRITYRFPVLLFIGYWAFSSLIAYSWAGEKMPWLAVHITLPMILLAGWAIARFLESIPWRGLQERSGWLIGLLVIVAILGLGSSLRFLLGEVGPFQGSELEQLQATSGFITGLVVGLASVVALSLLSRGWGTGDLLKIAGLFVVAGLFVLTARAGFRAAYVNYDNATEFLVYAHSAPGPKIALEQIEDISRRTTDGLSIEVAYDNEMLYPYWWYLRRYTSTHYFADNPTREILNYPIVVVGDANFGKVAGLLGDRYHQFNYIRLWWPTQDYFGLTWERIWNAVSDPKMRSAIWDIWLNRDYTAYGEITGKDFSLENWEPSDRMRLYVRKDVPAYLWSEGLEPTSIEVPSVLDPYLEGMRELFAEVAIGQTGEAPGQFMSPRGLAVAEDDTVYVADSGNHRVQHLSADGEVISVWGSYANQGEGDAPGGTFNEPWGVAVAPDGSVYVADTWNHRVQHFTANGEFIGMFGYNGQGETYEAFWGPRDVAVDSQGRVFVTDTGNKRVVVFDKAGTALFDFGGAGLNLGQMDEPVGVDVDQEGRVYITDTWNGRIQVFEETEDFGFQPVSELPIDGWFGTSLENKPYLSVDSGGNVCTTDPEGYRVLCFGPDGEYEIGWGDYGVSIAQFGLPIGVAFDLQGRLWVSDSPGGRLLRFSPDLP